MGKDGKEMDIKLFEQALPFEGTWWLYYCLCFGTGLSMPMDQRPPCGGMSKSLCIKQDFRFEAFRPLCSSVDTLCCLWRQCELPPAQGSRFLRCCNNGKCDTFGKYGKPTQVEMS